MDVFWGIALWILLVALCACGIWGFLKLLEWLVITLMGAE